MDEPMEDDDSSRQNKINASNEISSSTDISTVSTLHRTMVTSITLEEYEATIWPDLVNAIDQLLQITPGHYLPLSYEQVYSCVYKCVCRQFSERLYNDLISYITNHLDKLSRQLQSYSNSDSKLYIENFSFSLNQYLQAVQSILQVFSYLNRFYIKPKLKLDLEEELKQLFVFCVADRHVDTIISLLDNVHQRPLTVLPSVVSSLLINLHKIKPEYAQLRPQLFARYIPNILPACTVEELDRYAWEVKQMQRDLKTHPDFFSGDQGRKRSFSTEDDNSFKVPNPNLTPNSSS